MPRARKHLSNAAKQKAYRENLRAQGKPTETRKGRVNDWLDSLSGKALAKVQTNRTRNQRAQPRPFVAFDTEGITVKRNGVERHICCLLGDSRDNFIEDYKGLSTEACLDFLLSKPKHAIGIAFSWNYDANMILTDLSDDELRNLAAGIPTVYKTKSKMYRISWLPTKTFSVSEMDLKGNKLRSTTIYDTFGFFQKSFLKACREMEIILPAEEKIIEVMKAKRASFTAKAKKEQREYNALECKLLVRMMDKMRDAMKVADCVPTRWNGAGAIAATLLSQHGIKNENYTPEDMREIFLRAYFGGRIQPLQIGEFADVWQHDVVSAYPSATIDLPTSVGVWKKVKKFNPKAKHSVWRVRWKLHHKDILVPFPFRDADRRINYYQSGEGYYWFPEVEAALRVYGAKKIEIIEGYVFHPESEASIFGWIQGLFDKRKEYKASNDPVTRFAQIVIKLGLNSLYGKFAQSIGHRDSLPPFQNFFWAGYITSVTRARMFLLASQAPESIIAFATDGVFATKQLTDNGGSLGAWEVENVGYMFIVKAGVYAFADDFNPEPNPNRKTKAKTRGHKSEDLTFDAIREAWRNDGVFGKVVYSSTRFVGLKLACQANDLRKKWQQWIRNEERQLLLLPSNQLWAASKGETVRLTGRLRQKHETLSEVYKLKTDWIELEEQEEYLEECDQPNSLLDD